MAWPEVVLYVLRYYPTLSETFVAREIAAVQACGQRVRVLALGERSDGRLADTLPKVELLRPPHGAANLGLIAPALRAGPVWRSLRRSLGDKGAARVLWVAARCGAVSRIHAHFAGEATVWARALARLLGVPYTLTVHAVDLFKPRHDLADLLDDAEAVITICEHHARLLRQQTRTPVKVVRCGVDPAERPRAAPASEPMGVITVARDVPKKGLDDLVAVCVGLGLPLRVVSDAPRLSRPGVCVGPLPPSQVAAALAQAQLFVLPCRVAEDGDCDGLPVSIIEAMWAGLPVISTSVAGVPELVDDAVGWLIAPRDSSALEQALVCAAASPQDRRRRGDRGRDRVEQLGYTVRRQAHDLLAIWGVACSSP